MGGPELESQAAAHLLQLGMQMQRLTARHEDLLRERSRAVLADLEIVLAGAQMHRLILVGGSRKGGFSRLHLQSALVGQPGCQEVPAQRRQRSNERVVAHTEVSKFHDARVSAAR